MADSKIKSATDNQLGWDTISKPARLISRASRLLARIGDTRLRRLGFSVGQLPVLAMLKNGVALSQTELAQMAHIEQPSMAQILARMERDGLIRRVADPEDGRRRVITLTEEALSRLPEGRVILFQGHREALTDFSAGEIETLTQLLVRVIYNLENAIPTVEPQIGQIAQKKVR